VVHRPAFAPQQHVQAPVAVADPNRSQIAQPHAQLDLRITPRPVALR
jgi:hypothetical protein